MAKICRTAALGMTLWMAPAVASAAPAWMGDFETGDLSQWGFLLNPTINGNDYITVEQDEVAQGQFTARIELHNDAAWSNGLKRVEMQHRPQDARTAEGATTFFAWSVFLPEALAADPSQQIGYWESNNTFQQVMSFEAVGTNLSFATRRPQNVVHWQGADVLTPGEWHRIAMSVTWSTDPGQGLVNVWFDGEQVVTDGAAQTLADSNPHFVQVGLLRGAVEFDDVPTILLDHALEGDSLEDVEFDVLPGVGGEGTDTDPGSDSSGGETTGPDPDTTTGVASTGSDPETSGSPGTAGASTTGDGGGGTASPTSAGTDAGTDTEPASAGEGGGCSISVSPKPNAGWLWLAVLGLFRPRRRGR